jgi:hypothetical protein
LSRLFSKRVAGTVSRAKGVNDSELRKWETTAQMRNPERTETEESNCRRREGKKVLPARATGSIISRAVPTQEPPSLLDVFALALTPTTTTTPLLSHFHPHPATNKELPLLLVKIEYPSILPHDAEVRWAGVS